MFEMFALVIVSGPGGGAVVRVWSGSVLDQCRDLAAVVRPGTEIAICGEPGFWSWVAP